MDFVYTVMTKDGVLCVCRTKFTATNMVNNKAISQWGINPETELKDFTGGVLYGWADKVWWEKQVLYD